MKATFSEAPIGIFDSGIGGLTLANAIHKLLPQESFIYFGDTAHLPYGEKSTAAIQAYTVKIIDVLLKNNCKVILIACYSASAAAYELAREYTGSKAKVFSMIDPVVKYVEEHYAEKNVGIIGTRQTINSGVFKQRIEALTCNITLKSLATPLLANIIEEGFFNHTISRSVINQYLSDETLKDIDALILGCTHYPLISKEIDDYYTQYLQQKIPLIDASVIVAEHLKSYLTENNLLNTTQKPFRKFLVSDFTRSFEASTALFFGSKVDLEHYKLWE